MNVSNEYTEKMQSYRVEYQLVMRWFLFVQGTRLLILLGTLSVHALLFRGLYGIIITFQEGTAPTLQRVLLFILPMVALAMTHMIYLLLNLIEDGIRHIVERGIAIEAYLGIVDGVFHRALTKHDTDAIHLFPPKTLGMFVRVSYGILMCVWSVVFCTVLLDKLHVL